MDVTGSIKIVDGTQGSDKVLTSDANGLASWKTISNSAPIPSGLYGYCIIYPCGAHGWVSCCDKTKTQAPTSCSSENAFQSGECSCSEGYTMVLISDAGPPHFEGAQFGVYSCLKN